jgi:hypothetical protein
MTFLLLLPLAHAAPAPLSLVMDPLWSGHAVDIAVYGAEPGETVELYRGGEVGRGACPPGLGACLKIRGGDVDLVQVLSATADADGVVRWSIPELEPLPSREWAFQAIVRGRYAAASDALLRPSGDQPDWFDDPYQSPEPELLLPGVVSRRSCRGAPDRYEFEVGPGEHGAVTFRWENGLRGLDDDDPTNPVFELWDVSAPRHGSSYGWTETVHNASDVPARWQIDLTRDRYMEVRCVDYELLFRTGESESTCVDDPGEPLGDLPIDSEGSLSAVACVGDLDRYVLELTEGDDLVVHLAHERGRMALRLVSSSGESVQNQGWGGWWRWPIDSTGTWILEVEATAPDPLSQAVPYTLTTKLRPAEPCVGGGRFSLLEGVHRMTLCPTWSDRTTFELPPGPLAVGVEQLRGLRDSLYLIGVDPGEPVLHNAVRAAGGVFDVVDDKPHLLTILPDSDAYVEIEISVSLGEAACVDDVYEPSDEAPGQASPLPVGEAVAASLCGDDIDVWATDVTEGETLTWRTTYEAPAGAPFLTIVGAAGEVLGSGVAPLEWTPTADGTVYVLVGPGATSDMALPFGRYTLEVAPTPCVPIALVPAVSTDASFELSLCDGPATVTIAPPPGHLASWRLADGTARVELLSGNSSEPGEPFALEVTGARSTWMTVDLFEPASCDTSGDTDTFTQPTPLTPGVPVMGAVCDADEDWYVVDLAAGDAPSVAADGRCVAWRWFDLQGGSVTPPVASTGSYVLEVFDACTTPATKPYTATLSVAPDTGGFGWQDAVRATSGLGSGAAGPEDWDWWLVDVMADTTLRLWSTDGRVVVRDAVTGQFIRNQATTASQDSARLDGFWRTVTADATWAVGVRCPTHRCSSYDLLMSLHDPVCSLDDHEPDDTLAQARPVPPDLVNEGRLCRGGEDWIALDVARGDRMRVRIDKDDRDAWMQVEIWAGDPPVRIDDERWRVGEYERRHVIESEGPHYLRLVEEAPLLPIDPGLGYTMSYSVDCTLDAWAGMDEVPLDPNRLYEATRCGSNTFTFEVPPSGGELRVTDTTAYTANDIRGVRSEYVAPGVFFVWGAPPGRSRCRIPSCRHVRTPSSGFRGSRARPTPPSRTTRRPPPRRVVGRGHSVRWVTRTGSVCRWSRVSG